MTAAAVLVACGGGGGSGGESQSPYSITLRTDKSVLPTNTAGVGPGIGVAAPYTTTLYVNATTGGQPIPGGSTEVFGCNVEGGLETGSLYYLDGDDAHTVEVDDGHGGKVKVPKSYRSITLGANSGGNSFHFHSGSQAGTARITCTVQDPRDKKVHAASLDITVGAATNKAASVRLMGQSNVLGTQGNTSNFPTSTVVDVQILDDANQPLSGGAVQNVQVRIRPGTGAAAGARLLSGSGDGNSLWLNTSGGIGKFTVASGPNDGSIVVDVLADRSDNDVTNGIQDPIAGVFVISAMSRFAPVLDPLVIETKDLAAATNGVPYSYVLDALGGQAPYNWAALGALPAGLTLSASGVISGTPNVRTPGPVSFVVRVTDAVGNSKQTNLVLTIGGTAVTDPLSVVDCSAVTNTACQISPVRVGERVGYALTTTGGPAVPVAWTYDGLPTWLTASPAGVITSANPAAVAQCGNHDFFATATKDTVSTTVKLRVTVESGPTPATACP